MKLKYVRYKQLEKFLKGLYDSMLANTYRA